MNAPPTTETYTLSLHDALPIFRRGDLEERVPDLRRSILLVQSRRNPRPLLHRLLDRAGRLPDLLRLDDRAAEDRKSTRLNSSHANISYAVFCLQKKN